MTPRSNLTMSVNNIVENSQNILNYLDKLKEEGANEDNNTNNNNTNNNNNNYNNDNDNNSELLINNINPRTSRYSITEYFSRLSNYNSNKLKYITYVKDFIYVLINKIRELSKYICELETQRNNMKQRHNKMSGEIYRLNKKIADQEEEIKTLAEICKDSLNEENTCNICFTRAKTHINTLCGHKAVCLSCSEKLENKCPICRCNGNFIRVIST